MVIKIQNMIFFKKGWMLVLVSMLGCSTSPSFVELALSKKAYNGNELKIDGGYYYAPDGANYHVYFLFRNGILLLVGSMPANDFASLDSKILAITSEGSYSKTRIGWGVFNIALKQLSMEEWTTREPPIPTLKYDATILNDSTFNIYKGTPSGGKSSDLNLTFHFRSFTPKPDSTNNFIP
jgi:hypothetical protein